jgi:Tfp pilus assembly protein PilO
MKAEVQTSTYSGRCRRGKNWQFDRRLSLPGLVSVIMLAVGLTSFLFGHREQINMNAKDITQIKSTMKDGLSEIRRNVSDDLDDMKKDVTYIRTRLDSLFEKVFDNVN